MKSPPSRPRSARRRRAGPSRSSASAGPSVKENPERDLGFYAYSLADVMTRKVIVVRPRDSLEAAALLISRHHVSGLPVVDRGRRVVGVLSQKDIARVLHDRAGLSLPGGVLDLLLGVASGRQPNLVAECLAALRSTVVEQAMSRPPFTLPARTRLDSAIRQLTARGFNRIPVVRGTKLVGIVARSDLITAASGPS